MKPVDKNAIKLPLRYIPRSLTKNDQKKQLAMLLKSRKAYRRHSYFTRKRVPSFHSKPSSHLSDARRIFGIDKITPNKELAEATGCSVAAMNQIVKKGEGAYFSSGSRPNQTAQSWGLARLASSLTGGKAAAVDFSILEKGCDPKKKAFRLAKTAKQKYGHGQSKTKRRSL
jgi:DNA-binding Xre family transcriptional regulator